MEPARILPFPHGGSSAPIRADRSSVGGAAAMLSEDALRRHRELMGRLVRRDPDALRALLGDFGARLHAVAFRIVRDPETAREVVQDVFVRVWSQAERYRPDRGEVVSWLVLMARNLAVDRLRRRGRYEAFLGELAAESDVVGSDSEVESRDAAKVALGLVSGAQRRALELAFFQGLTQTEIAEEMGMPVGNVKNHLKRGLAKLRRLFSDHD